MVERPWPTKDCSDSSLISLIMAALRHTMVENGMAEGREPLDGGGRFLLEFRVGFFRQKVMPNAAEERKALGGMISYGAFRSKGLGRITMRCTYGEKG